jgi:adenylate/nucleoside-diphosphate kinase
LKGAIPSDPYDTYNLDVIEYANRRPLQILVLAKPKSGKTTYCRAIAKKFDIELIEPQILIE